ncbi:heptaprenyl diphosphate synthase component 1 [Staphylococcus ratti]|uniref:Heptaprenyl diphosphate synthase component 1 n=1 Tax=Staphylococcus ratti TaxID=2892440 RepID=A0ABY3PA14_9STAP|nr:heptaprenyl diphosphate synthase component 1 [Staphylococcus ratti]UEX89145.1 heptaprenyl diphosphate synthase component 1 [Staphylococcus ratti]
MSKTFELLESQISNTLTHIHKPTNVLVNHKMSDILDTLTIPELAKVAVLSIDTAMNHLDRISYYHFERDAILIGDLYSAHYYYVVSQIQSTHFQKSLSEAIIKINALKSYLQNEHHALKEDTFIETVFKIETHLIDALIEVYQLKNLKEKLHSRIIAQVEVNQLTYLNFLNENEIQHVIDTLHSKYKYNGVV